MRYVTFSLPSESRPRPGIVEGDRVVELAATSLLDVIRDDGRTAARGASHPIATVRLLAPIQRPPKNVFCVGRNYAAHVREGAAAYNRGAKLPDVPQFFTKAPTTLRAWRTVPVAITSALQSMRPALVSTAATRPAAISIPSASHRPMIAELRCWHMPRTKIRRSRGCILTRTKPNFQALAILDSF